jgi:hypothetical protein
MNRIGAILACALLASSSLHAGEFPDSWTWDGDPQMRADHAGLEGKPMPNLTLWGWMNGATDPATLKGKVLVVDF